MGRLRYSRAEAQSEATRRAEDFIADRPDRDQWRFLGAFPNTIMTSSYLPGPGWVPSSAARHAAEFIETHAGQPLTLGQIATASGVTARALQYAFRRHYGTTPTGYLRRLRGGVIAFVTRLVREDRARARSDEAHGDPRERAHSGRVRGERHRQARGRAGLHSVGAADHCRRRSGRGECDRLRALADFERLFFFRRFVVRIASLVRIDRAQARAYEAHS